MRIRKPGALALPLCLGTLLLACGATNGDGPRPGPGAEVDRPDSCPATARVGEPLPGVEPRHRTLDYWLERTGARHDDLDAPLLGADDILRHNEALRHHVLLGEPVGQVDLLAPVDADQVAQAVRGRLESLHGRLASGALVGADGQPIPPDVVAQLGPQEMPSLSASLHIAKGAIPLRCGPRVEGFYKPNLDLDFDRNACSTIHPEEPVQVLAEWGHGVKLARTPYVLGWIPADAPLSQPLTGDDALRAARREPRPLTRRALLEQAFALLDTPYGWGGHRSGRDCSRYVMDVLGAFGIGLPRNSARQARAGTFAVDVSKVDDEGEKLRIIEAAADKGAVLLHFPGHIMMYLGRTEDGRPMAIHSFSEYVEPCEEAFDSEGKPLETLRRVDRVTVSDLELGRHSSRTSFMERITLVTVLGHGPGLELGGVAERRPAAPVHVPEGDACRDSLDDAIFRSPRWPHVGAPLRVIATHRHDPDPAELVLVDPDGERHTPDVRRLGGPPFTLWAQIDTPKKGRWTAVLGDGDRVVACERFFVHAGPKATDADDTADAPRPPWEARWKWEEDTENLFAAFVEQLFTDPVDDDVTWPHLQAVLSDPARNLLYDHLGLDEDSRMHLEPDCADLPYFLRAYFAWKIELPFGYRRCTRGRAGRPPLCGDLKTMLDPQPQTDPVEAFREFARRVANTAHSASVRTAPGDDASDLYPVPLTREALRPGTVYADPYGHLLVVAAWRPQRLGEYGVLVAADAQPDGTVGRRRFWRGSFLFTPDTTDVGAGFKRWRPIVRETDDEGATVLRALDNDALRASREHVPYSQAQYEVDSADAFYDQMEALINPRPRDPASVLISLVDALEESALRRVNSVDNGETFMARRGGRPIEMPEGYSVFETAGAWEDFSTPSRDMRLLISIDAVTGFPDAVARTPERFGIEDSADRDPAVRRLRERLTEELRSRRFEYTRSDGSTFELSLQDLVDRKKALEMAYNPNDCVEVRWAAPEGSAERETCQRRAPEVQQGRMARYRDWFAERQRPPR